MKGLCFIVYLICPLISGAAYAGNVSTTLAVSATVVPVCEVSTTAVAFGNVTAAADVYANGNVSVKCLNVTAYVIDLDAGLHYGNYIRRIANAGNMIGHALTKDNGFTEWGDSGHANTYSWGSGLGDTGNGSAQSHTVYGRLYSFGTTVPAAVYTDTVTVTVYF